MCSKANSDYVNYTTFINESRAMTRTLCASFEHQLVNEIKDNSKVFWNYARSKTKTKSGISEFRKDNGSLTNTDLELKFFISVFTQENTDTMPEIESISKGDPLKYVIITPNMVLKKLSALNQSKSPGQDGFHQRVLKELKDVIALPFSTIYKISLNRGKLHMD